MLLSKNSVPSSVTYIKDKKNVQEITNIVM